MRLTKAIQLLAVECLGLKLRHKLDNELFNHISYVANRCIFITKQHGVSKASLIKCGKYLWRLLRVAQAYNHKRRDVTLHRVLSIVAEFKKVFGA